MQTGEKGGKGPKKPTAQKQGLLSYYSLSRSRDSVLKKITAIAKDK